MTLTEFHEWIFGLWVTCVLPLVSGTSLREHPADRPTIYEPPPSSNQLKRGAEVHFCRF